MLLLKYSAPTNYTQMPNLVGRMGNSFILLDAPWGLRHGIVGADCNLLGFELKTFVSNTILSYFDTSEVVEELL
jgi:hypothetical protein